MLFFRMSIRAIVLLRRLLCSRGSPERGFFVCFFVAPLLHSDRRAPYPSRPIGLVWRDLLENSGAMGLVGAVDSISRDWSLPSIRCRAIGQCDPSAFRASILLGGKSFL